MGFEAGKAAVMKTMSFDQGRGRDTRQGRRRGSGLELGPRTKISNKEEVTTKDYQN